MVRSLLILSALTYFAYGQAGFDCNAVQVSVVQTQALDICIGQQITINDEKSMRSSKYSCNDDNSAVYLYYYENSDCVGDPSSTELVQDEEENFECTKSQCPIFEWRAYVAEPTESGDSCQKVESGDFVEGSFPINFCFVGNEYVCSGTMLQQKQYYTSAGELLAKITANLIIPDPDTQMILNCTAEVVETTTLYEPGCNEANNALIEVQQCSLAHSVYHSLSATALFVVIVMSTFV